MKATLGTRMSRLFSRVGVLETLTGNIPSLVSTEVNEYLSENPPSGGVQLGETSTTAYRGDRGKSAYDHSLVTHAPTDSTNLVTVKSDADIASAISLSHQTGYDQALDTGGLYEVTAQQAKEAYDHSQETHGGITHPQIMSRISLNI